MNTYDFTTRARDIHKHKYEYIIHSSTILTKDAVKCRCSSHGIFETKVHDHLYNSSGCPECAREAKSNKDKFITMAEDVHGKRYNYSDTLYTNSYTPVKIGCGKHGNFMQVPTVHLNAIIGCPKCSDDDRRKPIQDFINDANKVHGTFYEYKNVAYTNIKEKVEICCPIHGSFFQTPDNHINNGAGCPCCANLNRSKTFNAGRSEREANKNDSGIIYLAHFCNKHEEFIKIGITAGIGLSRRFGNTHRGYCVSKILERELPIKDACMIETKILDNFRNETHTPIIKFGGYTECFNITAKDNVLKQINRSIT